MRFDFIWVALLWHFAAAESTPKPKVEIPPLRAGQEATLTCTVPALSSVSVLNVTWTWRCVGGSNSCINGSATDVKTKNPSGHTKRHNSMRHISTLNFTASARNHGAQVTCNVSFSNHVTTETTKTLSVNQSLSILDTSACVLQSDVLTCVCLSEGLTLPTIKWPLLKNRTDYTLLTKVANKTVNSTVTMTTRDSTTMECVSSIGPERVRRNLLITEVQQKDPDFLSQLVQIMNRLEVIVALLIGFLLGIIVTSFIACLARKCRRQKVKLGGDMEDLEMENTLAVQKYVGHAAEGEGIPDQEEAEVGVEPTGSSAPDSDVTPKDVEYSHIDFSLMKVKNAEEEKLMKESTETEYAEIKKDRGKDGESNAEEGILSLIHI